MRSEARHSIVLVAGTAATAVFGLAYSVYAARRLGPAQYADFTAAIALVTLCYMALGPINGTVAKFTAQYAARGAYGKIATLSRAITRRVALYGLIGCAAWLILLKPLASLLRFHSHWPLVAACGMIYLTLLLNVPRGVLRGAQRFGTYNVNIACEAVVRLMVGVAFLSWTCTPASALSAHLVGLAVVLILSRVQLQSLWRGHEPQSVDGGEIKRFIVAMSMMMLAVAGAQTIDMLMVKHFYLGAEAGAYGAAHTLARSMSVLATPFSVLMIPLFVGMREHEKGVLHQRMAGTFMRICGYFLAISAGPMILFGVWPAKIISLLYGNEYAAAAPLLFPLAGSMLVGLLSALMGQAFAAMNRFKFLYIYLAGLALEVVGLCVWHGSLQTVVTVVFTANLVTAVALGLFLRRGFHASVGRPACTPD